MAHLQLGNTNLTDSGNNIYVIAEIGQNHQGSFEIAKQMIFEAKKSGCSCVKFQKSCLSAKFTKAALSRPYHNIHSWGATYGEHKQHLEFTLQQYKDLQKYCNELEIDFSASAMDEVSLEDLRALNMPFIKIGSGDADNFPLLQKAASLACPLVVSTGMQTMKTVDNIVNIMNSTNKTNYALLHCVSSYPTEPADCTLSVISTFKQRFPHIITGYSGHELGIEICKAAILLGAKIIERHFTLDKNQTGSDHKCSLEPNEFWQLIQDIQELKKSGIFHQIPLERNEIVKTLQNADPDKLTLALRPVKGKTVLSCEMPCKQKLGKSIVAMRDLPAGHSLLRKDVCIKVSEPNGVSAQYIDSVLGAELKAEIKKDDPITDVHVAFHV